MPSNTSTARIDVVSATESERRKLTYRPSPEAMYEKASAVFGTTTGDNAPVLSPR